MTVSTSIATTATAAEFGARPTQLFDASRLWSPADARVELSVVVPFYNPGAALRPTVERLVECLRGEGVAFEVLAVSDGSTDGSEATIADLEGVRVISAGVNQGKGAALHLGFATARGSWIGFVDADGDIDPRHLVDYLRLAREGNLPGVYANKRHEQSDSGASGFRKIVSLFYSTLVTMLFLLGMRDTQTGCKVLRRDVLADLLPRMRERRFAFDLEFFVAAKAAGIRGFVGAPVRLEERVAGSTVTSKAILRTIKDTFVIFGRLHLTRQYRPVAAHAASRSREAVVAAPAARQERTARAA
jgi:glycosyltransferase involved in cell wall biosynthesis